MDKSLSQEWSPISPSFTFREHPEMFFLSLALRSLLFNLISSSMLLEAVSAISHVWAALMFFHASLPLSDFPFEQVDWFL